MRKMTFCDLEYHIKCCERKSTRHCAILVDDVSNAEHMAEHMAHLVEQRLVERGHSAKDIQVDFVEDYMAAGEAWVVTLRDETQKVDPDDVYEP